VALLKDLKSGNTSKRRRSKYWRAVRKKHLEKHPACAVCESTTNLEVHHIIPFSDPSHGVELELVPSNLLTLCDGLWGLNCHFVFGHLRNWRRVNTLAIRDARSWHSKLKGVYLQ
jgi:hypothetical protein